MIAPNAPMHLWAGPDHADATYRCANCYEVKGEHEDEPHPTADGQLCPICAEWQCSGCDLWFSLTTGAAGHVSGLRWPLCSSCAAKLEEP